MWSERSSTASSSSIPGPTPEEIISAWKANFGEFWYPSNRFYAPAGGIAPGEVAVIGGGKGPTKITTGVRVIYADERSWSYMTPEGHPWAAIITFSAHEDARLSADLREVFSDPMFDAESVTPHDLKELAASLPGERHAQPDNKPLNPFAFSWCGGLYCSPRTATVIVAVTSVCSATVIGYSPTCLSGPSGMRTCERSTSCPSFSSASTMS